MKRKWIVVSNEVDGQVMYIACRPRSSTNPRGKQGQIDNGRNPVYLGGYQRDRATVAKQCAELNRYLSQS